MVRKSTNTKIWHQQDGCLIRALSTPVIRSIVDAYCFAFCCRSYMGDVDQLCPKVLKFGSGHCLDYKTSVLAYVFITIHISSLSLDNLQSTIQRFHVI